MSKIDTLTACGIICEYNPFHNGHLHQLNEARKKTNCDVIICVMSGNLTQRGQFAICDKWKRAEVALEYGADLVVELPPRYSCQMADIFSAGAIDLLKALNCDYLSFGVENDHNKELEKLISLMINNSVEFQQHFQKNYQKQYNYATNISVTIQQFYQKKTGQQFPVDFHQQPNNLLAFRYMYDNMTILSDKKMKMVPILREVHHHDQKTFGNIASGSAIRKKIEANDRSFAHFVPEKMFEFLKEDVIEKEIIWPFLNYQLTVQSKKRLKKIYLVNEGMENNLKKNVIQSTSLCDFCQHSQNRRWPYTKLNRMLMMILLQITQEEMKGWLNEASPIHILGFSKIGQQYLSENKKQIAHPIITTVNRTTKEKIPDIIKVDQCLQIIKPQISEQNFSRIPILSN